MGLDLRRPLPGRLTYMTWMDPWSPPAVCSTTISSSDSSEYIELCD